MAPTVQNSQNPSNAIKLAINLIASADRLNCVWCASFKQTEFEKNYPTDRTCLHFGRLIGSMCLRARLTNVCLSDGQRESEKGDQETVAIGDLLSNRLIKQKACRTVCVGSTTTMCPVLAAVKAVGHLLAVSPSTRPQTRHSDTQKRLEQTSEPTGHVRNNKSDRNRVQHGLHRQTNNKLISKWPPHKEMFQWLRLI